MLLIITNFQSCSYYRLWLKFTFRPTRCYIYSGTQRRAARDLLEGINTELLLKFSALVFERQGKKNLLLVFISCIFGGRAGGSGRMGCLVTKRCSVLMQYLNFSKSLFYLMLWSC